MPGTSTGDDKAPPAVAAAASGSGLTDWTSEGTAGSVSPLVPGSEEIVEEARRADAAFVDAGTSPRAEAEGAPCAGGGVFVQRPVPVSGVCGPAALTDDTSNDASAVDEDHRAAGVPWSVGDRSVKVDVDTPGTDWVMAARLVRSRATSFTEVASRSEEEPRWDVRTE